MWDGGYGFGMHHGWGFGGGLLHMVLFWGVVAAVIVVIVVLVAGRRSGTSRRTSSALAILEHAMRAARSTPRSSGRGAVSSAVDQRAPCGDGAESRRWRQHR